jgi:hypothetical protein
MPDAVMMFPFASTVGSALFTTTPVPPSKPLAVTMVPPVPVVVPPGVDPVVPVEPVVPVVPVEEFTVDEPLEPCVVGPPLAAEAVWLAAVLPLARLATTALLVCALRWSTEVVLVGAMTVLLVLVVPLPDVAVAGTGEVMTAAGVELVVALLVAVDEVPKACIARAAGMACAITGAAKSAATRRASEAALWGLRIDLS